MKSNEDVHHDRSRNKSMIPGALSAQATEHIHALLCSRGSHPQIGFFTTSERLDMCIAQDWSHSRAVEESRGKGTQPKICRVRRAPIFAKESEDLFGPAGEDHEWGRVDGALRV